jgi:hypothetical protein
MTPFWMAWALNHTSVSERTKPNRIFDSTCPNSSKCGQQRYILAVAAPVTTDTMPATNLNTVCSLSTVHPIRSHNLSVWHDLAPIPGSKPLWSRVTCQSFDDVDTPPLGPAPSSTVTSHQPTGTVGPSVDTPDLHHEAWKVTHPFPKGTSSIHLGLSVILEEAVKEVDHTLHIKVREGTVSRVWKREVKWLHFLVDLNSATDTIIAGKATQVKSVVATTRVTLAVPRQLTSFNLGESLHLLLQRHTMDAGAFWALPKHNGKSDEERLGTGGRMAS